MSCSEIRTTLDLSLPPNREDQNSRRDHGDPDQGGTEKKSFRREHVILG